MPNNTRLRVEPLEDRATPSAAGDPDPTFSGDGTTTTSSGPVRQLALAPDGHVLALTNDGLTRLEADGDPDPTFAGGGVAALPSNSAFGGIIAASPYGGAYYVTANFYNSSAAFGYTFTVVRYTDAGALDTAYGNGGTATLAVGNVAELRTTSVLVQPDGGVVVVGSFTGDPLILGQPPRYYGLAVGRLTVTGQPDPSFGANGTGVFIGGVPGYTSLLSGGAALAPDGRIVIAGSASTTPRGAASNGRPVYPTYSPAAFRFTAAGQLDPTFGTGGIAVLSSGGNLTAARVLDDGRTVFAGSILERPDASSSNLYGLGARLTPDGRLDPTYDGDGVVVTARLSPDPTNGVGYLSLTPVIDGAGRVVFGAAGGDSSVAFRLTPAGAVDAAFGSNGRADVPLLNKFSSAVFVQPNGDLLFGGTDGATGTLGRMDRLVGVATPAGFTPAAANTFVATGPTDGTVQVLTSVDLNTTTIAAPSAYVAGLGQNLRPAMADVTGDGTPDYVLAAGPGGPPRVVVLDGSTGRVAADFAPFETTFAGGAFVAAADLDRDGRAEVIVTPDQGGGGRVVVYSVATGGAVTLRASFFGIDDPNFRGGARVAAGDVNRDGTPDVIVAAGFGGGPRTAIFGGASVLAGSPARLINDFFAFPGADAQTLRNGVFVAAGDVDGDGFADLIFGGGPGGAPRVFILGGALVKAGNVAGAQAAPVANFFVAGNSADRGGVRVVTTDADGDARADVAAGSGEGSPAKVRVYLGANFSGTAEPGTFQDLTVFGGASLPGGVFVG